MKFSMKMAVLSMAGVLALGGAATAASFIFTGDTKSGVITADGAVVLEWGKENTLADIETLNYGEPVYQTIEAKVNKSSDVTSGQVVFNFTLSESSNLKIEISDNGWDVVDTETNVLETFTSDNSVSVEKDITDMSSAKLYLKYSLTEATTLEGGTFSAKLKVSVSYQPVTEMGE